MSEAWISKEWRDSNGKLRRKKADEFLTGVRMRDTFIVEWTFNGRRKRQKIGGCGKPAMALAIALCHKIRAELTLDQYVDPDKPPEKTERTWTEFRQSLEEKHLAPMHKPSAAVFRGSLDLFERLINPTVVSAIDAECIAGYLAKLREQPGRKAGSKMGVQTIRKHAAILKVALGYAHEWKYRGDMPVVKLPKAPEDDPVPMPLEIFKKVYAAANAAIYPKQYSDITAAEWWRAALVLAATTGARLGELLALEWACVDLENGLATIDAQKTKAKRTATLHLVPLAIQHLMRIRQMHEPEVLPWDRSPRKLWDEFERIQRAAGVTRPAKESGAPDEFWGFHSLRKLFLSANASRLSSHELMVFARHRDIKTTMDHYVQRQGLAREAMGRLWVPELPEPEVQTA